MNSSMWNVNGILLSTLVMISLGCAETAKKDEASSSLITAADLVKSWTSNCTTATVNAVSLRKSEHPDNWGPVPKPQVSSPSWRRNQK